MNKDNKKTIKYILIILVIILSITLLSMFAIYISSPKNEDSEFNNSVSLKNVCKNDVCVTNVSVKYKEDGGTVIYTLKNKSSSSKKGSLKLVFDKKTFDINYDLKAGEETTKDILVYEFSWKKFKKYSVK